MTTAMHRTSLALATVVQVIGCAAPPAISEPVAVILDSDIGPDCDDAGAAAVLNALADNGEAEILAMMCCISSPWGAPCLQAINTYYGRGTTPIGTLKTEGFLSEPKDEKYNKYIAHHYPNSLKSCVSAPDAIDLYRQILSARPDKSVVIVAIGPLVNLKNLLASGPDRHSHLSGRDLVDQKVKLLSVMGGAFPAGTEWNFQQDPEAARVVTQHWPSPIIFSGFEIGYPIMTGKSLSRKSGPDNPVRKAYELYTEGMDRQSWNQTAVLAGVHGTKRVLESFCQRQSRSSRRREQYLGRKPGFQAALSSSQDENRQHSKRY